MSTRYTPGPWRYEPTQNSDPAAIHAGAVWYIAENDRDGEEDVIALIVKGTERGHSKANARLIAKAPEMLRMLHFMTAWVEKWQRDGRLEAGALLTMANHVDEARTLLKEINDL